MKKLIFAICILILVNSTHAQFSFSVKPGLSCNGASFGYRFGNIVGLLIMIIIMLAEVLK